MQNSQGKWIAIAALVLAVGIGAYLILNAPDHRTTGERIGDAVDELPNGPDKAVRELKDRTPGERLEDSVKDAGDDIKKETRNP